MVGDVGANVLPGHDDQISAAVPLLNVRGNVVMSRRFVGPAAKRGAGARELLAGEVRPPRTKFGEDDML